MRYARMRAGAFRPPVSFLENLILNKTRLKRFSGSKESTTLRVVLLFMYQPPLLVTRNPPTLRAGVPRYASEKI